jgi:ribonuclease P/MRP protein subunit POP5
MAMKMPNIQKKIKKIKTRVLIPTLRDSKRYLVYNANYFGGKTTDYTRFKLKVKENMLNFIGELGYGEAGIMFIKGNSKKGIIRVNRNYLDHLKTGLMTVKKIENNDTAIRCLGVSGTLDKAEKIMLNRRGA